MTYQPETNDYHVWAKRSELDPSYFYYHFWHYQDGEWKYLYKAPEVVMVENLRGHNNLYAADGYDYWRRD